MAVWNERLLEVFCDLCIKEVDKNNRPHTHFNAEGWTNIINGFEQETGKSYTKKQLKNKWDALKSELRSWKELKGKETGLGWDHRLQTIDAPDEWWRAKIEVYHFSVSCLCYVSLLLFICLLIYFKIV